MPYCYSESDSFRPYVKNTRNNQEISCVVGPGESLIGCSLITVSFAVKISGEYTANFKINGQTLDKLQNLTFQAGKKKVEIEICVGHELIRNGIVSSCCKDRNYSK